MITLFCKTITLYWDSEPWFFSQISSFHIYKHPLLNFSVFRSIMLLLLWSQQWCFFYYILLFLLPLSNVVWNVLSSNQIKLHLSGTVHARKCNSKCFTSTSNAGIMQENEQIKAHPSHTFINSLQLTYRLGS